MSINIVAVANQKGGVGKTTTCANLGIGLARIGEISTLLRDTYGGKIKVLPRTFPIPSEPSRSAPREKSIFTHGPNGEPFRKVCLCF